MKSLFGEGPAMPLAETHISHPINAPLVNPPLKPGSGPPLS
jgi:hypothetical protein